jgi:hypothetical protein
MQFDCGTRILRVIHGWDARATLPNCTTIFEFACLTLIFLIAKLQAFEIERGTKVYPRRLNLL